MKGAIDSAAGFSVPLEINWESLSRGDDAHLWLETWAKVYFEPLIEAFRRITIDDMGKSALKAGLKKIVIQNTRDVYSGSNFAEFANGVLVIDHLPTANVDYVNERIDGVQKTLEAAL